MRSFLFIIAVLTLGFANPARAVGIWVEPFVGYEFGNQKSGNTSYDESGLNLGFRLGGTSEPLYFGLEYSLASLTVDKPNGDDSLKTKDIGLFLGAKFSMIRVWLTYLFDSENDSDNANSTYKGDGGYKIGLGVMAFTTVSLNVEKSLRIYDKSDGRSISPSYKLDGTMISLSLPFSF